MKRAAVIAAAGRSTRMGRPKALLPIGEKDVFVTHLARVLLATNASAVVVTVPEPPDDEEVTQALSSLDVLVTRNLYPDDGLAGSLATALERLPDDVDALVVCPVDMPFVTVELVEGLCALVEKGAVAAVPVVSGARGHPVVVGRELFREVRECAAEGGLRAVLSRHDVRELPWSDALVLENLNTPADYERVMRP